MRLSVHLILLAASCCIVLSEFRKVLATFEERIVGGDLITIEHVPYLVNLRQNGQFSCGGSLITHKCILTAAHCVYRIPASTFTIYAGATHLTDTSSPSRQILQTFVPKLYSPITLDMDVAVLKLNQSLYGSNIKTISLCSQSPANDEYVQIMGWGVTSEYNREPSNQVRTAMVKVLPAKTCKQLYAGKSHITNTMFCASVGGERDSCSGDSGGPVVYRGQLCGIVSWGIGCARPQYPGVYTNVANLRVAAFVKTILMQNCF